MKAAFGRLEARFDEYHAFFDHFLSESLDRIRVPGQFELDSPRAPELYFPLFRRPRNGQPQGGFVSTTMSGFGNFTSICENTPLPLCALVGPVVSASGYAGVESNCFARNIEVANTLIFEGAASALHIVALVMTVIMILHVRSKFTAVGRKEILVFFYLYMVLTFVTLLVDAGVVPPGSNAWPYFVSIQNGFSSALITCLLINGFVGFQLYEDGTPLSLWMLRICSFVAFLISFLVSLATFMSWAGLGPNKTIGLFVVLYIVNAIELFIYVALQILLVTRTLRDRWPLGDIAFGIFFFVAGQVLLYVFSNQICNAISHYLDGLFFATACNLLAVMMIYKVRAPPSNPSLLSVDTKLTEM